MSALTSADHTTLQAYVFSNSAYHINTLTALVQLLHRACFIPIVYILCKAIDSGYFTTWQGLTFKIMRKHLPNSIEMAKGLLRLSYQHVRSTSAQPPLTPPPIPYTNL